jgi:hypothetical protein
MQMKWRVIVMGVALYVGLDLSMPSMPGALVFDPDDCIEAISSSGARLDPATTWGATETPPGADVSENAVVRRAPASPSPIGLHQPRTLRPRKLVYLRGPSDAEDH